MNVGKWEVGQMVKVASRTWAGINKPGGCAKVIKIHYHEDGTTLKGYDVKYLVGGGSEKELDPALLFPFEMLERGGRSRRGRDFLFPSSETAKNSMEEAGNANTKKPCSSNRVENKRRQAGQQKKQVNAKRARQAHAEPIHEASPETTSPSTQDAKPKAKKVTPIPSYVIANNDVHVSPLERIPPRAAGTSHTTCRRGLFDSNGAATGTDKSKRKAPAKSDTGCLDKLEANVKHVPKAQIGAPHSEQRRGISMKENAAISKLNEKKGPVAKHSFETPCATPKNQLPVEKPLRKVAIGGIPAKSSACDDKRSHRPVLSIPRPTVSEKPKGGTSIPLKQVYANEMEKATKFVNEVVGTRESDIIVDPSKENASTNQSVKVTNDSSSSNTVRHEQFLSVFRTLRVKLDDDGSIEEANFLTMVNSHAPKDVLPFTKPEIDRQVKTLSDQGKIMISDGTIYMVE